MANKSKVETIDNSTVVLNDEAVETPVNDIETVAETNDDTSCPVHSDVDCQCKPGHCPNKACKSGNYWTTAPSTEKYVYHYDSDNEDLKLTDADHRKENPAYVEPTPTPTPDKKDDEDTGSDDCGPEREELKDELGETEYKKIKDYADKYRDQYDVDSVKRYLGPERKKGAFIKKFTFNGWLLPADKKLIALSPIEPPFDAFRKEKIVLFEPFSGKAVLAKREWKELWLAFRLYRDALKLMKKHKISAKNYRENIHKFTSMESWKKYLHIADYK